MTFEEFQKKVGEKTNPERAFKLYTQVKLSILEEVILNTNGVNREKWEKLENRIFDRIIDELGK
jgi:hypothetical protein